MFGKRYRAERLLKTGQGMDTWLGIDTTNGAAVVIKKTDAATVSAGTRLRLEHEAEVMRHLAGASLTSLLDVGDEAEAFYFVMPFVPGITLAERLRRAPLSVVDTLSVGRSVMRALKAAHDQGVLHRDVKPANIIVSEESPPEPVTLIDFGLSRSARLDASLRELPVGTIAYVSPEQAGLIHREVGETSDLYSAGIVLFECLAGHVPFSGSVRDVLRQHVTEGVPDLRQLGIEVPRALAEVIQRLVRMDPRDRYASAAGALADLDEIAEALEHSQRLELIVGTHDRRCTLTEPAFLGREAELRAFEGELDVVAAGAARLVVLEGESGSGKSRLLDEVAVTGMHRGAWVLRGGGVRQSAPRPLQILDNVAEEIVAAARGDPKLAPALRERLGDHTMAVSAALPRLRTVLATGHFVPLGPEAYGEARSLPALVALLDALGTAVRPAVVLLDDCQWADEVSLKLLHAWQSAHATNHTDGSTSGHVLLVAAFRPEEVPDHSLLRRLEPSQRLTLTALADREVRRIAESMAGALPDDAAALVAQLADGNPFLARAVLEGLIEGGALIDTDRGWQVEPQAMVHAQSSRRAAVFLERSIDGLPPKALAFLSVGAVLGKTFGFKVAADLSGQTASEAMASVAAARRRHLVWIDASGAECLFVHDRIRENLLGRIPPAEQERLHGKAALLLARGELAPDLAFDLAYHFDAAGDHTRALPYALRAAAQAREQYALEVAEGFYRIAARGADDIGDASTRRDVSEGLGEVLLLRGSYDEAGNRLRQARELAESKFVGARIEGKLGELAFKRGDVRAAEEAIQRALSLLGRGTPTRLLSLILATLYQATVQIAHTLLPWRLVARRRLDEAEADLLAVRLYSRLAYAYWFNRGQVATFWAHLNELNLAERYPPTRELAQACSEHAISVTGLPRFLFRRGVRYAERGMAIRRALGDLWGEGQSLNFHGILLYAFAHYVEALAKFRDAQRVLHRTGDRWEDNIAGFHIALCLYRLGELRSAIEECQRVYRQGQEIGDAHAMVNVLEVWSKASGGAVSSEMITSAMRRSEGDAQSTEMVLQAEGVRLLRSGRLAEGAAAFAAGEATARAAHLRSEYVSYAPLWTAHALMLVAVQEAASLGVLPPERVRTAERALRRGMRLARRYRGNLPMALRDRALLRAMAGRPRAARRDLDRSLAEATAQGARFQVGLSLLSRGELGRRLGWADDDKDSAQARDLLFEIGADFALSEGPSVAIADQRAPVTLSLADRFNAIIDEGFRIASAMQTAQIREALCAAATKLLRCDATVLLVPDESEAGDLPELASGCNGPVEYSRSLVRRALAEGQSVVELDSGGRNLAESLVLGRVRSAVCAPILSGGRTVAFLYAVNHGVGELFGEDEKRIARFLATLAGASLDKAAAFTQLEELSQSLERRVEERTAELGEANRQLDEHLRRLRDTQDQLVHAARMAAVGTLVAGLSHELNNPIQVIVGYAQSALQRMKSDDPLRQAMAAIERQATRCANLVGTLLEFSRKGPVARHDLAVDELVGRVAQLAEVRLRHGGVSLKLEPSPPAVPFVSVSRTEIESALFNLVSNAVDASPRGGRVSITSAAAERGGRKGVTISVRDEGSGIPQEMLSQIFDPFFTTKPVGSGTGLGLSLAREFVEAHGGALSAESEVGRGTTMKLWLPASGEASRKVAS
jgi:signal transduction histidine kinase/tetratricopeptide (TPR) repeat protein